MSGISIAKSLELLLLPPTTQHQQIESSVHRAATHHLAAVTVWPAHAELANRILADTDTKVRTAIAFPYGYETLPTKILAMEQSVTSGVSSIVVMLDHALMQSDKTLTQAVRELKTLSDSKSLSSLKAPRRSAADLAIVLESEIIEPATITNIFRELGEHHIDFVHTGTSFQASKVTPERVRALREVLPDDVAIIAAGGVSTLDEANALLSAGAVRVASAAALSILDQEKRRRAQA